ncbi:MAG: exodeoxyribonuclease VII large subunit [Synergistaceae bacterium]|nr:exodeoxyribonuclease VII large subunit [Synergistaceae bacterium]
MNRDRIVSVDEMTASVKEALFREALLQNLSVHGELSGFKLHTSGHAYFTLLGRDSRVSCVLFRSYAASVLAWPRDGDEVLVRGRIDVYGARGSYQLYATALLPLGAGAKARAKEALRLRLEKEGLFDVRLKRPLPRYPERVAVITSPTGAALQDVLKLHALRFPCAELVVIPSLMQGLGAAEEVVRAFEQARGIAGLSALILARGGGSRDDLDIFDEESVVRAVRLCPVPVITGLGHQIDSTLADLAADAAAPTPSGAAERLFPDGGMLEAALGNAARNMRAMLERRIGFMDQNIREAKRRLDTDISRGWTLPAHEFARRMAASLKSAAVKRLSDEGAKLSSIVSRLESLSPLSLLARGYSICSNGEGKVIRSVGGLHVGERVTITMNDGSAAALIESISKNE